MVVELLVAVERYKRDAFEGVSGIICDCNALVSFNLCACTCRQLASPGLEGMTEATSGWCGAFEIVEIQVAHTFCRWLRYAEQHESPEL